jgi:hypothetical protein
MVFLNSNDIIIYFNPERLIYAIIITVAERYLLQIRYNLLTFKDSLLYKLSKIWKTEFVAL